MSHLIAATATALALLAPLTAVAGQPAEVQIYDRNTGRILPVYWHGGERHVAGEPGHEYEIRIRNRSGGRILAVTSVDGVNVITGTTASPQQSGYVIGPRGSVDIDGWRKSLDEVAAFYFTSLPDSYAARSGRPDNVGVIGIALFNERRTRPIPLHDQSAPAETRESPAARARPDRDDRLGTGHGERRDSAATWTNFRRAGKHPDAVVRIYYDSHSNLVARGIIPQPEYRYARRIPNPFPNAFVPDP